MGVGGSLGAMSPLPRVPRMCCHRLPFAAHTPAGTKGRRAEGRGPGPAIHFAMGGSGDGRWGWETPGSWQRYLVVSRQFVHEGRY